MAVQHADAVGTDEGSLIVAARVQNALLQHGPSLGLLAEACGYDDKRARLLLAGQQFHIIGTVLGCNDKDGQLGGRQLCGIVECLDALYLVLFRVDDTQCAAIATAEQVADNGPAGLMDVVGSSDDDNALGVDQLSVNHVVSRILR